MEQAAFKILEKSIRQNDMKSFRSTLQTHGLPAGDYNLLLKSLRLGRKRMAHLLLDRGCRLSKSSSGSSSTSPLHLAVTKVGWSSVALKLLARGARVVVRNGNGDTPIHAAFANGAAGSVIDLLLKFYARETLVEAVDKDGLGLLHIACARPRLSVVKGLVDIGGSNVLSQVSLQTNSIYAGYTALHFAVENGRHKIAKFLCECEADVGVLDGKGSTPLHLAVHRRDVTMIDILLRYADWNCNHSDADGVTHFMAACASSDPDAVKQFLRIADQSLVHVISARVRQEDCPFAGYTPMHFAAEFGRLGTMQLLIDRGAHCTTTPATRDQLSPLDLARKRNHETMTALLEQHCRGCKVCVVTDKNPGEALIALDDGTRDDKEKQSEVVFKFDSLFSEASLDDCCLLDIFPLPPQRMNQLGDDCELCKLQEIFLIDDRARNRYRDDDFCKNLRENVGQSSSVICKYIFSGQFFALFVTLVACVSIVAFIVTIAKYKNNIHRE